MNSENLGGSYNGYGFNPNGTERDRDDFENLGHSANNSAFNSPYHKEEIAEEVEEQGYEETVREDLDRLFAELDKQPRNARILGYIESTKEILAHLEKEVKAEGTESMAKLGENQFKTAETARTESITSLDEKPNGESYIDRDGFSWSSREQAIQNDDDKHNW